LLNVKIYLKIKRTHGKNGFAKRFKILAGYK